MRVLLVSNTPFLPADAGNRQRISRMVEYLRAQGIEIGMLLLPDPAAGHLDVDGMAARVACFELARPPAVRRAIDGLAALATRLGRGGETAAEGALGVDDWCPPWFRARAAALARAWRADAVLVEYVFLSACLDGLAVPGGGRPLSVIDTHDVMHQRAAAYVTAGLAPQWFTTSYAEERRGLLRADVVLAISQTDARVLREMLPGRTVLTVPHGEVVRAAPLDAALPARLLFVASYNDINVRGLGSFLDASWSTLRTAVPGVELVVCGTIATKLSHVPPGVTLRGFVPSLADEYARARVVINPVRAGTGLQIKLVEALCHGRPVVSTPGGAEGVCTEGVVTAGDEADFAGAVRRLCQDDALWRRLAVAATEYAARTFAPDAAFGPLVRHLGALPGRCAG